MMITTPTISNFKTEALTDERLRLEAPSIFAPGPMTGLSTRYTFVSTTEIVAGLRDKGWLPVNVKQQRPRSALRFGFQKHQIRFRLAEQMQTLDEWNAELVLTNSHDAGCAYVLRVGIYRRLCSNGLVASDESFEAIRFRHAGLQASEVVQGSYRILDYLPAIGAVIDRFRNRLLTDHETLRFAEGALTLRYGTRDQAPIEPRTLLTPRRHEDESHDLWTAFNRTQEHLTRGGLSDNKRDRAGKLRTLRALRGIDSKITLNKALWNLAELTAGGRN